MCQQLAEIRKALCTYTAGLDPGALSCADAERVVDVAAAIEAAAAALKAVAATRAAEGSGWRDCGAKSAAESLARQVGLTPGEARQVLDVGRALGEAPELASAALEGRISPTQAGMIGRAVKADPRVAGRLVEGAGRLSIGELRDEIARTRAAASDLEARYEGIRRRRRLRAWTDPEGVWHLNAVGPPDAGAQIMAAVDARRDRQFRRCRAIGVREHPDLYAFDALHDLALQATSSPGMDESARAADSTRPDNDEPSRSAGGGDLAHLANQVDSPCAPPPAARSAGELDLFGYRSGIERGGPSGSGGEVPARDSRPVPDGQASTSGHRRFIGAADQNGDHSAAGPESPGRSDRASQGGAALARHSRPVGAETASHLSPPAAQGTRGRGKGRSRKRTRLGAPVKLLLRVDYDTWLRGLVLEGETCELAGYGPIPVSVARQLVTTGDAFVAAILTKGKSVVGVAHLGRAPNVYQRSALEWLYPTCAAAGCVARVHLEADHRIDWVKTHITVFDHLDLLCSHHHRLKTTANWALAAGEGKRPFVPPEDPRHPRRGDSSNRPSRSSRSS